jgi:hypothetical protein
MGQKMKKQKIRLRLKVELDRVDFGALTWYQDATVLIRSLYGDNWRLFVDLLASTSPRSQVKKNWRISDAILKAYLDRKAKPKHFGDLLASKQILPAHLNNVIRSLQGRPIHGQKVWRFAENLKGNLDVVTIDVWICRAYGIDGKKDLTPDMYKRLEKRIVSDAKRTNATPAGYQAVLWYAVRREAGLRAKSFVSVYRSIFCETPCFDFMQETE